MSWVSKHAPESFKEVVQEGAIRLMQFVRNYKDEKRKAAFLFGPAGSGKSSTIYAIAKELDLEVVETNASDARTKDKLHQTVGAAMTQMSLFGRGKLILLDEVDGLSGTKDRGAPGEIAKLVEKSAFPVILTANDAYHSKLKALRKKCLMIEFAPLETDQVQRVLERIQVAEGVSCEPAILRTLARRSGGDMRAAINDFQSVVIDGKVDQERLKSIGARDQTEELQQGLFKVFKTMDMSIARSAYDNVAENYDDILPWIDENVPYEYTNPEDLARAYDSLSRANIFRTRIMRRQHWRYLVYISMHLTAGIASAKTEKNRKQIEYKQTKRFLKMWMAKMKYKQRISICEQMAEALHCSTSKVATETLSYLKVMARQGKMSPGILDKDQIAWLSKN